MCPKTKEQREMPLCGFEKDRKTLKYRCPAAVFGLQGLLEMSPAARQTGLRLRSSGARQSSTGTVAFHPCAASHRYLAERLQSVHLAGAYFSRFDQGRCFERHYIRRKMKMQTRVNIATAIMMSLAHYRADRRNQTRSPVKTSNLPKAT